MDYTYRRIAKAPSLPEGKWKLGSKSYDSEKDAVIAAAMESKRDDGKAIQVWQEGDPIKGFSGSRGFSVTVKKLSRKGENF